MYGSAKEGCRLLYRPGKRAGRWALTLGLILPGRPVATSLPFDPVQLLRELGYATDRFAIMRSTGRDQWVMSPRGPDADRVLVKVAAGNQVDSLRREVRVMSALANGGADLRIPQILSENHRTNLFAAAIERVPTARMTFDLESALAIAVALAQIAPSGITHGDLAPWNILDGQPPSLIDWELAKEFEPGVDFAHYVLSSAYVASFLSAQQAHWVLSERGGYLHRYARLASQDLDETRRSVEQYVSRFLSTRRVVDQDRQS